jgi:TPR repeat protein
MDTIAEYPETSAAPDPAEVAAARARTGTLLAGPIGLLTPLCDAGYPAACLDLARLYAEPAWPTHDAARSASLRRQACSAGLAEACSPPTE